jgi:Xaa-Pro aminopeptidase
MLTPEERQWLDDYHQMVYNRLSPYLETEEKEWLREATAPLKS